MRTLQSLLVLTLFTSLWMLTACGGCGPANNENPWETSENQPDMGAEARIVGLVLDPTEATVLLTTSRQFAAIATYSDGATRDVTFDAIWEAGTDDVVEVEDGEVAAIGPGATAVTAIFENFRAEAIVTVPSAAPESLSVRPATVDVAVGEVVRLTAEATLTDGTEVRATELVQWASSDPAVAAVSNDPPEQGAVRGVADGAGVITATLGELQATADFTVGVSAQLATIEIAPAYMRLVPGQRQPFAVLARYTDGRILDVSLLADISSSDETVVVLDDRSVLAVAPGEARIDAELEGRVVSATIEVLDATVTEILISPPNAETSVGGGVDFDATAVLDDGTTLPFDDAVSWRIVDPAVAGIDEQGVAVGTDPGATGVEARFDGIIGTSQLTVFDAPLVRIDVEPLDPTMIVGSQLDFVATGHYTGQRTANLSWSCNWTSSNPDVVVVGAAGRADAVGLGVAVVTCAFGGQQGASVTTVTSSDLDSLEIEPVASTLSPGEEVRLTVWGRHDDGRTTDLTASAVWTADSNAVVVSNAAGVRGTVSAVELGNAEITAEFAGLSTTATVRVSDAQLLEIRLDPAVIPSLPVGASVQVDAVGRYDDGTERPIADRVRWSSGAPGVARVDRGNVTGLAVGAADVIAELDGVMATTPVTVTNAIIESISVEPAGLITTRGLRTNMTATATFSDGTELDVTSVALWSVTDPDVAFIGNGSTLAQLVALDVGTTEVIAEWDGVQGSTTVTVEGAELDSIMITPSVVRVAVGIDTQLVAIATYTDGSSSNVTSRVSWSSEFPGVASVNGTGLIEPLQPGDTKIFATFQGATAAANVTVTDARIEALEISPFEATIAAGDQMWFQAVALFSDGTKLNVTRRAVWDSLDTSIVRIESVAYLSGVTTAVAPGQTQVVAFFEGAQASANVTVTDAVVESIQIFPNTYSMAVGTELLLTAQAIYSDGSSRNVNWLGRWRSSNPDVANVGNAWPVPGLVTAYEPGTVTISVEYQGQEATAEIEVSNATLEAIQVFPFNSSITVGSPIWFQATGIFSDGRSVWLTRDVTWTSSDTSVASISNGRWSEGRTIGVAPGQVEIEATWNGVTGSASLVVSDKEITALQVTPFLARIPSGYGELFQAVAIFDDNTSRNVTQLATWETTNPAIASVGNVWWTNGIVLTHGAGQVDVKASWQNAEGQTSLTVTDAQVMSIEVTPAVSSVLPGEVVEHEALGTFDDGSTYELTLWSTWLSSDTSIANVSNAWGAHGEATAFSAGTVTIEAHKDGVVGTTNFEVR